MPTHGTTKEAQPSAGKRAAFASSHWPNPLEAKLIRHSISKPNASHRSTTDLADVAFLDIRDVCAAARMSASWIHDEVRARRFPQPLRFGPRCSRWRSTDVRKWLLARAAAAEADAEPGALLAARAKKASDAAQAKRRASVSPTGEPK